MNIWAMGKQSFMQENRENAKWRLWTKKAYMHQWGIRGSFWGAYFTLLNYQGENDSKLIFGHRKIGHKLLLRVNFPLRLMLIADGRERKMLFSKVIHTHKSHIIIISYTHTINVRRKIVSSQTQFLLHLLTDGYIK